MKRSILHAQLPRRAVLLAALGVFSGACDDDESRTGASAPSDPVTAPRTASFKAGAVRVGQRRSVKRQSRTHMSVEFWANGERWGTNEPARDETLTREETVVAVVGRAPSRVRVHYSAYHLTEQKPDEPVKEDALLEGQSYVVDGAADPMRILGADGQTVLPEVRERLLPQHAHLAEQDPVVERLLRGEWEVGKSYALHEKLFRAFLGADKGAYERGQVRIVELRKLDGLPVADFEWSGTMSTQEEGGMEVQWEIEGAAVVALVPAQVLKTELTAELEVSGKTRKADEWIRMTGAGKVTDRTERTAWQ